MDVKIDKLKGVSSKIAKPLKNLGVETVRDLLFHIPFRYDDFSNIVPIAQLRPGANATVQGLVSRVENKRTWKKRMSLTIAEISDQTGSVEAIWFNQPFLIRNLRAGKSAAFSGKTVYENSKLYLQNPAYETVKSTSDESIHTGRLVPVYRETRGITSRWIRYLIKNARPQIDLIKDHLPPEIARRQKLMPLKETLRRIHFPASPEEAERAKKRLAFDELFTIQLSLFLAKREIKSATALALEIKLENIKRFIAALPFTLTDAQRKSAWEILKDTEKGVPMNRLLEGDVGSGKTVVAAIAALNAALSGWQTVIMAPTEVLAHQHFNSFVKLFAHENISICLLTGKTATVYDGELKSEHHPKKSEALKLIKNGNTAIIVGTHALIQEKVGYHRLGLVILDEQHRFGVSQRAALIRGHKHERDANKTRTMESDQLLYGDLTYKIRSMLFKVKKELGLGYKEIAYQKAFSLALDESGLSYSKETRIPVTYNKKQVGVYVPDFVIEDKIIIELKALPFIGTKEKQQLWHYLKGSPYRIGLLVNFGHIDVEILRVVYDTAREKRIQATDASASSPQESAYVPHLLSMTATPIPRTLALALYSDLDISLLNEMPKQRKKIITRLVPAIRRSDAYDFVRKEIKNGRQAFVICPRIDPSVSLSAKPSEDTEKISRAELSRLEVKSVKEEHDKLSRSVFPKLRVTMLHGKMKSKEKEKVMREFKDGLWDILVSTSVIEVGVDIPNASVIMIEGAERFGLAQLHQFRGRVGRSEHQSYCFLLSETDDAESNRRLRALLECDSGFQLAEKDLAIRGPGDFFGTRQSGLPDLAMASLTDAELIKSARDEARKIIDRDPTLEHHEELREQLRQLTTKIHLE